MLLRKKSLSTDPDHEEVGEESDRKGEPSHECGSWAIEEEEVSNYAGEKRPAEDDISRSATRRVFALLPRKPPMQDGSKDNSAEEPASSIRQWNSRNKRDVASLGIPRPTARIDHQGIEKEIPSHQGPTKYKGSPPP